MDITEQAESVPGVSLGKQRFCRAATTIAHLCGLVLKGKRYIERSPVVQWATFYLQRQIRVRSDLLFNISDYSKRLDKIFFEKLKRLLCICPKQRSQQDILKIQACLKTNRAFQCLPSETQLQLCQVIIYQKYEAGTIITRQGHMATECYLVLSGKLEFRMASENAKDKCSTSETICEAEEGDFIGEACLLTNTRRPSSVICKTDTELVVISKEDFKCILASIRSEQHHAMCQFLRKHPLFSTWPPEKIDFLLLCSLQRFHRTGTTVVTDGLTSYSLVIVQSGRCIEAAKLDSETTDSQHDMDSATQKMMLRYKSEKQKPQEASLTPRFLKIRTLEQSDIFGLADIMDKDCALQLSLISEGAECIFIPKRLFLKAAPAKSRQITLEILSSYPTKRIIQERYNMQQAWITYKTKLIGLHLAKHSRPGLVTDNWDLEWKNNNINGLQSLARVLENWNESREQQERRYQGYQGYWKRPGLFWTSLTVGNFSSLDLPVCEDFQDFMYVYTALKDKAISQTGGLVSIPCSTKPEHPLLQLFPLEMKDF